MRSATTEQPILAAAPDEHDPSPTLLDFNNPHFRDSSTELFADLRARCPVAHVRFGVEPNADRPHGPFNGDAYLVTRYDEGSAALLDDRIGVDATRLMTDEQRAQAPEPPPEARLFRRNLLGVDPPDHTRLRKLVQPSFTNRQMEALRPRVQQIADDLLDAAEAEAAARGELAPQRTMELIGAFAFPLPIQVICELLGVPTEDQQDVRRWFLALPIGGEPTGSPEETRATLQEFIDYLTSLFERRRQNPGQDLISELVHAEEDGDRLSGEELLAMVFILLAAGHVTTVNLIASGTLALLTHPEQLALLRNDPELVKNAVEETLRYWGPLDMTLPRFALDDITIDGMTIPRGNTILVGLASANHDPARFARPEEFDITRTDANRHIAFGKGIHACLGAPLARLEGQIALTTLLTRYPELRLNAPVDDIGWRAGFLRSLEALPLRF